MELKTLFLIIGCVRLSQCTPLPPLPDLTSMLGAMPRLLQVVTGTTGTTGGVTTGVTTGTSGVTTTLPAMMTMAPMLPAVALGIVKAIFINEVIKEMKPKCYGYDCHHGGYGHGHHGMKRFSQDDLYDK